MKKIVSYLTEKLNISERNVSEIMHATISVFQQRMLLHEWILVNNVALFAVKKRPEKILIYPDNFTEILIPPRFSIEIGRASCRERV